MQQKAIDFRELLERVLPLDRLPLSERDSIQRALRSGIGAQIEDAALAALQGLERAGAVKRLPAAPASPFVRYQSRDRLDVITLPASGPLRRDGWVVFPRAALPPQIRTGIEPVRRLLRIDDPALLVDPTGADARGQLGERLQQAGRELLAATEVRFVTAGDESAAAGALMHPAAANEVLAEPSRLWYAEDLTRARGLRPRLDVAATGSVVVTGVTDSEGTALGHLEITAPATAAFQPDDLALVALLADCCGTVLERAARLEKLVFMDALTGAYNRSYFELQLEKEMARAQRERGSMALSIVDIDDFKSFNTRYGYEAGNEVLASVAHVLRRGVRSFDTVARWGGEEFVVLLAAPVQPLDVVTVSERLRSMVERQIVTLEGLDRRAHRVGVTVSIGVALYPNHAESADDLWRAANQALLLAKRPPKNQVVFFPEPDRRPHIG